MSRLKEFRTSLKLQQKEFAESIGVNKTTYSNYEIGTREPSADFWISISRKYNVSIDYLLGISEDPYIEKLSTTEVDFKLLKKYRRLNDSGKEYIDSQLDYALMQDKYTQGGDPGSNGGNVAG